jgi:YebC/PmpR family DNA-binding regulatory protein
MSGHSHFSNIKRKKEAGDMKRAVAFSTISRLIISAVRDKGKDPQANSALRIAIEKARDADMPKENIERAIKRGAGEGETGKLETFLFEVYGGGDVAFIVEGATDNKNRALTEIKEILKKYNGKMANPGSVKWLFDQKGIIEIEKEDFNEEIILDVIEAGAEDIKEDKDFFLIYTAPEKIENIKSSLLEKNIEIIDSRLGWKAKNTVSPENKSYQSLLDELLNYDSIEQIYINI